MILHLVLLLGLHGTDCVVDAARLRFALPFYAALHSPPYMPIGWAFLPVIAVAILLFALYLHAPHDVNGSILPCLQRTVCQSTPYAVARHACGRVAPGSRACTLRWLDLTYRLPSPHHSIPCRPAILRRACIYRHILYASRRRTILRSRRGCCGYGSC